MKRWLVIAILGEISSIWQVVLVLPILAFVGLNYLPFPMAMALLGIAVPNGVLRITVALALIYRNMQLIESPTREILREKDQIVLKRLYHLGYVAGDHYTEGSLGEDDRPHVEHLEKLGLASLSWPHVTEKGAKLLGLPERRWEDGIKPSMPE